MAVIQLLWLWGVLLPAVVDASSTTISMLASTSSSMTTYYTSMTTFGTTPSSSPTTTYTPGTFSDSATMDSYAAAAFLDSVTTDFDTASAVFNSETTDSNTAGTFSEIMMISSTPSTVPNTPSTAPNIPSTAPNIPSTATNTPSTAPNTPSTAPNIPSTAPNTPSTAPNTPSTAPNTPSTAPNTPSTAPNTPSTAPNIPSTAPNTPSTAPNTPSTAPNTPSTAPNTPSTAPNIPSTAPNTPSTATNTPSTAPNTPSTAPNIPSTAPNTPSTAPNTPSTAPNTPSTAPNIPSTAPNIPSTAPNIPSKPNNPSTTPNTPSTVPNFPITAPSTPSTAPNTPSTAPNSISTNMGSTLYTTTAGCSPPGSTCTSTSSAMATTTTNVCVPNPCQNGGVCNPYVGSFYCVCGTGFNGTLCETYDDLNKLQSVNMNDSTAGQTINNTLTNINNNANIVQEDTNALDSFATAVNETVKKLDGASTWTPAQKETMGRTVVKTVDKIVSSIHTCTSSACQSQQVETKIHNMEESVMELGGTLAAGQQDVDVEINDTSMMTVKFQKKAPSELVKEPITTAGVSIKLPDSLADDTTDANSRLLLKVIVYDSSPYVNAASPSDGIQAGSIIIARLENEEGVSQSVDTNDPILLTTSVPSTLNTRPQALQDKSIQCLTRKIDQYLLVEFSLPSGKTLSLIGRMDEEPTDTFFDFAFTVRSSGVSEEYAYPDVSVVFGGSVARLFVSGDTTSASRLCVRVEYSGATGSSGTAKLVAPGVTSSPALSSSNVNVVTWDLSTSTWKYDPKVKLNGVDKTGKVQFRSNFFGTFSLTDMVVAPTPIDFSNIFLNFEKYLRDSPYVLSIICVIFLISVIVIVFLRRLDKTDAALWAYLPLIDNDDDPCIYALSVHTSLSSARSMSATPFFVLAGHAGDSGIRILCDGTRQNFGRGTVSNFILRCSVDLGVLTQLRIWHNNKGINPHWKLDRVVVTNQATQEITIFVCRDWLSATKGDARLSRHLAALSSEVADGGDMFDMVSKQRLFDDHLLLSITRRPVYSTFSRVQRYVTAVAVIFMSMVSNAMFYQGKEVDQVKLRGIEIGPVQINYRQLFVGVVSAVITVIPAVLIAFSFKRRKLRGVAYPDHNTLSIRRLPSIRITTHNPYRRLTANTASFLNDGKENMEMTSINKAQSPKDRLSDMNGLVSSSQTSSLTTLTSVSELPAIGLNTDKSDQREMLSPGNQHAIIQENVQIVQQNVQVTTEKTKHVTRENVQITQENMQITQKNVQIPQENVKITQENVQDTQDNVPVTGENQHVVQENTQTIQENVHNVTPEDKQVTEDNKRLTDKSMHTAEDHKQFSQDDRHITKEDQSSKLTVNSPTSQTVEKECIEMVNVNKKHDQKTPITETYLLVSTASRTSSIASLTSVGKPEHDEPPPPSDYRPLASHSPSSPIESATRDGTIQVRAEPDLSHSSSLSEPLPSDSALEETTDKYAHYLQDPMKMEADGNRWTYDETRPLVTLSCSKQSDQGSSDMGDEKETCGLQQLSSEAGESRRIQDKTRSRVKSRIPKLSDQDYFNFSQSADVNITVEDEHLSRKVPEKDGQSAKGDGLRTGRLVLQHKKKSPFLLPWWFIFVGYAIATLAILGGAFFTFLYSLQWGGKTSLDWLLAFFFAISTGNFLVEPLKIVVISIALSCLFRSLAEDEISAVAPFTVNYSHTCYTQSGTLTSLPAKVPDPADDGDTDDMERRANELRLQRRMFGVLRALVGHMLYVTLLSILCFHMDIHHSFRQNEVVRAQLATTSLKSVHSPAQTWTWLRTDLVPSLLPIRDYRNQVLTVMQRRFLTDQDNFRVGPITLTQYRVKGSCNLASKIQDWIGKTRCVPDYSSDTEETGSFSAGWVTCRNGCSQTAYLYEGGEQTAMAQQTRNVFYGPGGYRVMLDQTRWKALDTLQQLQQESWIDDMTRAVNVEVNLFNPNTRLFTQAKILLEYPSSGSCLPVISLRSARLYPYVNVWDYLILLLQMVFILLVLGRICLLLKRLSFPAAGSSRWQDRVPDTAILQCAKSMSIHAILLSSQLRWSDPCPPYGRQETPKKTALRCWDGMIVTFVELMLSLTAIIVYIIRIDRTIMTLERIRNQPETFTSWDVVFFLDQVSQVCLSVCLFISILSMLGPLAFNRYLYVLRKTLLASRSHLYGLFLSLSIVLFAFVFFFVLFSGPVTFRLRNLLVGLQTLLTVLLTMTKYTALTTDGGDELQGVFHKLMYGFYCFVAAVMVMNFAITILNVYLTDVKQQIEAAKASDYNGDLGQFVWSTLRTMFSCCGKRQATPPTTPLPDTDARVEDDHFQQLESKLEEMLGILSRRQDPDPRLREVLEELNCTRNRLRQAELEAKHRQAQLVLWKEQANLSHGDFMTEVSFYGDKTVIRVLDERGTLLFVVAWTEESEGPLSMFTATELTAACSADLDLDNYSLVGKPANLSISANNDFPLVEVGYPADPSIREEGWSLAARFTDSGPWLYLPVGFTSKAFCAEERSMVWGELEGVPKHLAALQLSFYPPKDTKSFGSVLKKCPDCQFSTPFWTHYRAHRIMHTSASFFQCQHLGCGKQFLERFKLVKHMQDKHSYPLICRWCSQAFVSRHQLGIHMQEHLERSYECQECRQRFYTRQQRDGHRFVMHGAWREQWGLGRRNN